MKSLQLSMAALLAFSLAGCAARKPATSAAHAKQAAAPALGIAASTATQHEAAKPAASAAAPGSKDTRNEAEDRVLIAAGKQAYDEGVAQYQAGQYQAARSDFDRAVDIFLTSGRDLKNDAELSAAFEHTVDTINALELDALQQGNGFSQQEESPVDVANDVTFPVDPNILARAQAELKSTRSDLPLVVNDYVASYINYFTNTKKGHNTIEHSLERAGRYRAIIQKTLAQEGVPQDLIYLAVAESGFQPRAVNRRSGAGGMWQFMPHGDYGLTRNAWVDERFDPEKSTRAYARYIKALHQQFGDWYLAMAAYDWGAGKVQRAVQRTGYADFWQLYQRNVLPAETKNYVPIIVAAAIMAKNPAQYGLADLPSDPPVVSDVVTTNSAISLPLVADLAGTTTDELESLNPSLLRMSTPADMAFDLHLPPGTKVLFEQRIALIPPEHRNSWRYHVLADGETLSSVAESFHVKTGELASVNQIADGDPVAAGQGLIVPVAPAPVSRAHRRYRARRGDTMVTVADRFGVTTGELRRWNGLHGNRLPTGRLLYVSAPVRGHRTTRARRHSTRRGTEHTRHAGHATHPTKKAAKTTGGTSRWKKTSESK